ncbi:sushi, von Willebrand factor type A, EGF and pentraxin domain-containing protein 1-like [Halichondria panicea]|uniref:sushi, von Willebrand factor type A, EGF and pentraxin domain-containing protein 1-like n=1 Tax=Halichondria panicea TaxID=6063 RepID=UPI00312BBA5B
MFYMCNSDRYHMSGSATVTCEASGSWSTRPTCSAICNDHQIENGDIDYHPDMTPRTEETIALYSCVSGYQLSGVILTTCVDSKSGMGGEWTGLMPSCIAICDSLTPNHGVISYSPPTTPRLEGGVATHNCDEGYGLSPSVRTRTCQPDRTWSGEEITCQRIRCSALRSVMNGTISFPSGTTAPYDYETTATYQCNRGHVLTNGNRVRTSSGDGSSPTGQWDSTAPQCPPVDCGTPPSITNGSPAGIPTTTTFTGTVTYSCNDGYALFGIATSTCQANTTWSRPPECRANVTALACTDLMDLVNGGITYDMETINNRPVDTVATYTCNTGYTLIGGSTSTCGSDGVWSGSPPKCEVIMCPPLLTITNGTISYSPDVTPDYDLGTEATYTCEAGFYLEGNEVRVCMDDDGMDAIGVWSGQEPSCVTIECPSLPDITNGMVSYESDNSDNLALRTVATYSCTAGFFLDVSEGDEVRTCLDDDGMDTIGMWSGQEPSCVFVPPPVRSVLFQLRLTNINNCPDWVDQDGRIEAVMSVFAAEVESHCGCGFSSMVMTTPFFRCFPGSDRAVTFRAFLTDSRLLTPIQDGYKPMDSFPFRMY